MSDRSRSFDTPLRRAHEHASAWLAVEPTRTVPPLASAAEVAAAWDLELPESPTDSTTVVDDLVSRAEPGLMASSSGKFFGWVIGGSLPAALAADWLVSAWDQNGGMRLASPATAAIEDCAGRWLLDLLHLPAGAAVGFTTGATGANVVGLAAARRSVLDEVGWDVDVSGLQGAPRVTVLAGEERHTSVDIALRYLGFGLPQLVSADAQGCIDPAALKHALADVDGPAIVCLQAGNLHSGDVDPMRACIDAAHARGAWVHVDGAFGLWASAVPAYAAMLDGIEGADSWATDAHKTLNVPYDCGVAIVAREDLVRSTFGIRAGYFVQDADGLGDPMELVPEMSRRARGVPVWAALQALGRSGVIDLVERLARHARALADGIAELPGATIENDVVFTQVSVSFGSDDRTRAVTAALLADGEVWMSGSVWHGRAVLRVSVSNWTTDEQDVAASIEAVARAVRAVDSRS